MNIHLKDKSIFDKLIASTIVKIEVGSGMYNLKLNSSDSDYLIIYANSKNFTHSFYWEHHQFQYKHLGIDYLFTTIQQFVRNILTGDSTINYECLFSDEINDKLSWLYEERLKFRNYNTIRSYLGLAKRDLKQARKMQFDQIQNVHVLSKKLSHIYRGLYSVDLIMNGNYYTNRLDLEYKSDYDYLLSLKNGQFIKNNGNVAKFLDHAENYMNQLKTNLDKCLSSKKISTFMRPDYQEALDSKIMQFCQTDEYISKQQNDLVINEIYSALEHGISYG